MKKLKMEIELTYDDMIMHGNNSDSINWFYGLLKNKNNNNLFLHSNELGETIGTIKVLRINK